MYGQPLKVTPSLKFLGVTIDNCLSMNYNMEHTEEACLLTRMNIARVNSTNATLLVHVYKIFVRPNMDYSCISLTARNKTQIHKLEVIQARRVYSSCISNKELCSYCNIVSAEQRIFALMNNWWRSDKDIKFLKIHQFFLV